MMYVLMRQHHPCMLFWRDGLFDATLSSHIFFLQVLHFNIVAAPPMMRFHHPQLSCSV